MLGTCVAVTPPLCVEKTGSHHPARADNKVGARRLEGGLRPMMKMADCAQQSVVKNERTNYRLLFLVRTTNNNNHSELIGDLFEFYITVGAATRIAGCHTHRW